MRGLDYYRHTAFEFITDRLGAQGTVLAGGRYDGLIESLGGPHTPAVGWAAGVERLAMMIAGRNREAVGGGDPAWRARRGRGTAHRGRPAPRGYRDGDGLPRQYEERLGRANPAGAAYAPIIGDDELDRGEAQLKDLATGEQRSVSLELIAEAIAQ